MINYDKLVKEHQQLSQKLASPDIYNKREQYQELTKRFSFLEKVVAIINERKQLLEEEKNLKAVIDDSKEDSEVKDLARGEIQEVKEKIIRAQNQIEDILFEQENEPERDVIIEIRSAAGGDEATLFAGDLFKMYSHYIDKHKWRIEVLNCHPTEVGGIKEIVFSVKGHGCYSHLKFESGVHRVQRVPETESGGRIHTSTATVAVLIEPKDVELKIDNQDLKIDTYRASGAGGQHVNKTDSAVRITHLPTSIVVACQDERSQIKNRAKALRILKARLLDLKKRQDAKKVSQERKVQVGTGERSEKIRTYNFPESRVTDHRINLVIYQLESVLEGGLEPIIKSLIEEEKKKMYEAKGLAF